MHGLVGASCGPDSIRLHRHGILAESLFELPHVLAEQGRGSASVHRPKAVLIPSTALNDHRWAWYVILRWSSPVAALTQHYGFLSSLNGTGNVVLVSC